MSRIPRFVALATAIAIIAVLIIMATFERSSPHLEARERWESPPNVVMVIIDTLRQDKLSAYGFPQPTSPAIDRMAAGGVRFARVIAQSSWTRPSIGSLLTSQYPRTLGIYSEAGDSLPESATTLAEVMKKNGYTTLGATANANINSSFNFDQGFDSYRDSTVLLRWMGESDGAWSHEEKTLQSARQIFDGLLAEVKARRAPPYFLQANVMEVHEYFDERIDLSRFEPFFGGEEHPRYLAAIRLVSEEIDRFFGELLALPGFERTLFVILSDHGEGLNDHQPVEDSSGHGRLLYGSQVVVPVIFYASDGSLPGGKVVDAPCRLLDLMPTLLDYLGFEAPMDTAGSSMMTAVDGRGTSRVPSQFVVETELRSSRVVGVHGTRWEYFEHREAHPGTDPLELQKTGVRERGSRSNQLEAYPEDVQAMQSYLRRWERDHPRVHPAAPERPLRPIEEAQLRELGYLD